MAVTFDSLLADDLLTVVERDDASGHYRIRLGSLQTMITIQLASMRGKRIIAKQSHAIKTELQGDPYWTSHPYDETPEGALHYALDTLTGFYREAVKLGHDPKETWLVRGRTLNVDEMRASYSKWYARKHAPAGRG